MICPYLGLLAYRSLGNFVTARMPLKHDERNWSRHPWNHRVQERTERTRPSQPKKPPSLAHDCNAVHSNHVQHAHSDNQQKRSASRSYYFHHQWAILTARLAVIRKTKERCAWGVGDHAKVAFAGKYQSLQQYHKGKVRYQYLSA